MPTHVLFVSVNESFKQSMTLAEVEVCAQRAWAITAAKAMTCDRVVAVCQNEPIAAWRLRGAYASDETYHNGERVRVALSLGPALPILPAYAAIPALRRGVATAELPVPPLPAERSAVPTEDEAV